VTFWYGSGSADPYLCLKDTNPSRILLFSSVTFKMSTKKFFSKLFCLQYYFLKGRNQGFSYYFCLMIEGSGSVRRTNGSWSAILQAIPYLSSMKWAVSRVQGPVPGLYICPASLYLLPELDMAVSTMWAIVGPWRSTGISSGPPSPGPGNRSALFEPSTGGRKKFL
jgi:hypothetical protein